MEYEDFKRDSFWRYSILPYWLACLRDPVDGSFSANMNQCAARPQGEMIWWAIIVSNLTSALLLTLSSEMVGTKGILDGLKIGAYLVSLLP